MGCGRNHSAILNNFLPVGSLLLPNSRRDNVKAHYATHGKQGGRNRYVATLDRTSPAYDPCFRGQLTADGSPVREVNMGLPDI